MAVKKKIRTAILGIIAATAIMAASQITVYADEAKLTETTTSIESSQEGEQEETEPISLEHAKILFKSSAVAYTGKEVTPKVTVKLDKETLTENVDYTLSYKKNINVGYMTASVKVTGIGKYKSSAAANFSIIPATNYSITLTTDNDSIKVNWAIDKQALACQVLYSTTSDFSSNVHSTTVQNRNYVNLSNLPKAGERWYVKLRSFITDTGTVSGRRYGSYGSVRSIVVKDRIRSASIPYWSYTYTGKEITPPVIVKGTNGVLLTEGKDYTISYSQNIKVGTAKVTLTGKGNIRGTFIKTFIVKPKRNSITRIYSDRRGTFTVEWNADSTATGYQVMYSTDPNFKKDVHTYSSSLTKEMFSRYIEPGKTYYVKVRSYLAANNTRYGNYSTVKTVTSLVRDINVLKNKLTSAINTYPGSWSVYVKNLRTQETIEINNRSYYAASLMKLYCMAATYDAIEKGRIAETSTVQFYLRQMITVSSNDAFNQLLRIIGKTAVRDWIIANGYKETAQFHGYSEGSYYYWTIITPGVGNYTSAADCAKFFESVYRGECVSKTASQKMMNLLKAQQVKYKAPAVIPYWVQTANKTGEVADNTHDCMLVFLNGDPYIFSVMSEIRGQGWTYAYHIRDLSKITYDFFSTNKY